MANPKLTPKQRQELLANLAAREPYTALRKKFGVSDATLSYYNRNYAGTIAELQAEYDLKYLNRGFRNRDKRLEELELLAERHKEILFREPDTAKDKNDPGGFYGKEIKMSASGEVVEYWVYNSSLVTQYRAILKDIATETGQLPNKLEISGVDGNPIAIAMKGYIGVNPDDWDDNNSTPYINGSLVSGNNQQ